AEGDEPRSVQAAAPRRGEDPVHGNAMLSEGLADRPGLRAPTLVHVALGRAVVDLEPGRIAVAGRRTAVADQRNVTAVDERGPGIPLICHGLRRRDDQPKRKRGESQTARRDRAEQLTDMLLHGAGPFEYVPPSC